MARTCGLAGCSCSERRCPVFTREFVEADLDRATALLNHAFYAQVDAEKILERPPDPAPPVAKPW